MNDIKVDDILQQIRSLSKQAGIEQPVDGVADSKKIDFSSALRESIDSVNDVQQKAGGLAKSFEQGDPNVNLSEVMIEMQKARVSFETLSQVRNKLITAYQEIMNMQV